MVKVREGLARNDYIDPGWYPHPKGTVAYAWDGSVPDTKRVAQAPAAGREIRARKPTGHGSH